MEASGKTTAMEMVDMEVNRGDTDVAEKSGTAGDYDEMSRMGKLQEFKVCESLIWIPKLGKFPS